ncbi:MAG: DUF2380 domain-containing protein, partial [bacterium]
MIRAALLAFVVLALTAAQASSQRQSVAVFDFELIDTSLEGELIGPRSDEQSRLIRLGDQLRQRIRESGRFSLADTTSVADEARTRNLHACTQCAASLARKAGADLALTGTIQ